MAYTVSELDRIENYDNGIRGGKTPRPTCCNNCQLYDKIYLKDCGLCCHPPVEDPSTQPDWCPFREVVG